MAVFRSAETFPQPLVQHDPVPEKIWAVFVETETGRRLHGARDDEIDARALADAAQNEYPGSYVRTVAYVRAR